MAPTRQRLDAAAGPTRFAGAWATLVYALCALALAYPALGGGFLVSLRFRVSLRLEAANMVLFEEDDYENVQSYAAGLGTYF